MAYFYSVTTTLPDEQTAEQFVAWLTGGHVRAVLDAGATSARVIRLDSEPGQSPRVESQYLFPDRSAYNRYVATAAPALRADGLAKFPPERGITMGRRQGDVAESW